MKCFIPLSLLASAALVAAQNPFYNVPACARTCATNIPSNCNGKPSCICGSTSWMWEVECCVANACSASDQAATFQFANQLCTYVGVSLTSPPTCTVSGKPSVTTSIHTSSTAIKGPTSTVVPNSVAGYTNQGCYSEATNGDRALNKTHLIDPNAMTVESCIAFCHGQNHNLAGVEYSQECWCGDAIQNGAVKQSDQSGCNLPCKGNSTEYCGGVAKLEIYKKS